LTNESVFSLTDLPARMVVLGSGPIGCELAQVFARLGSRVTLIERSPRILAREDPDAARIVEHALQQDGVTIEPNARLESVESKLGAKLALLDGPRGRRALEFDALLVGVGRVPNVDGLGLESAGVEFDRERGVVVDDFLRTTSPRIYAAGDVASAYKFTHMADALARIVIQNALFFGRARASALVVPWCTYTDPEVAHVGLYAHAGEARGIAIDTFQVELSKVDRAVLDGQSEGFLKVHVAKGRDRILGATLVSAHAGETISEIALAMTAKLGLTRVAKTIHPYPTQAEAFKRAADMFQRSRLTPRLARAMTSFLRWRRGGE
jgi:pyruvate/2-oxoglutarate dehydrogenase complex dihydrolipoamide dehydrogenase (E3) component